jgi:hypothetical protein
MARVTIVRVFLMTRGRRRRVGVVDGRRSLRVCRGWVVVLMVVVIARRRGSIHRVLRLSLDGFSHADSNEAPLDSECRVGDSY